MWKTCGEFYLDKALVYVVTDFVSCETLMGLTVRYHTFLDNETLLCSVLRKRHV